MLDDPARIVRGRYRDGFSRIGLLLALAAITPAWAKNHSRPPLPEPISAELLGPLLASRVQPGTLLFARVSKAWQGNNCHLPAGSLLQGHIVVVTASSKISKISQLALTFDRAQCGGRDMRSMPLTLAAVLGPDIGVSTTPPLDDMPLALGTAAGFGMRSMSGGALQSTYFPGAEDRLTKLVSGEVIGIGGLKLAVGAGPEHSSVLSVKGHDLRLQSQTVFALVPSPATTRAAPGPSVQNTPAASPSLPGITVHDEVAEDELPACKPPACQIVDASAEKFSRPGATSAFSLKDYGYAPRPGVELRGLDHESALAWLGDDELLITFHLRTLVSRTTQDPNQVRLIRALVLNVHTLQVERSADWRVPDAAAYLWPAGNNRVLAHVGNELRLYTHGLRMEKRIELDGPLAFVRIAPLQKAFAIGVLEERHTPELHHQLLVSTGSEPEEDVNLHFLDSALHLFGSTVRSSAYLPPVLTQQGEIVVYSQSRTRWHLVEHTWDRQTRSVAHLISTCQPEIASFSPGLLFVVTCERVSGEKDYRVLRANGEVLLKGYLPSAELSQPASGTAQGDFFALGIAEMSNALGARDVFHGYDLKSQRLAVYRTSDGHRVFGTRVESPASSNDTYALAPDAGQLAVLAGDSVSLYAVPHPKL